MGRTRAVRIAPGGSDTLALAETRPRAATPTTSSLGHARSARFGRGGRVDAADAWRPVLRSVRTGANGRVEAAGGAWGAGAAGAAGRTRASRRAGVGTDP